MKQKVFILLYTSMLCSFVSCDKVHNEEVKHLIQLGVELNDAQSSSSPKNITKGSETSNDNILDFGMYAFYEESEVFGETTSTPNFMSNVEVKKSGGLWSYSPLMYWPPLGSISFFAYSPYNANGLSIASVGVPKYTYTINSDVSQQVDLLLSNPLIDKTKADLNNEENLLVSFKHALSSVVFKASVQKEQMHPVKITSVTLQSMKNKGTATYIKTTATPQAWILNWELHADAADNNYALSIENGSLINFDIKERTTDTLMSTPSGTLMFMPQDIDPTDKIIVAHTSGNPVKETITEILLSKTLIKKFESGKKYTFKILIRYKVNVDIECTVAEWDEKIIDVPPFE